MDNQTIHNAIMMAANKIDNDPTSFRFMSLDIPKDYCGSGCALGWIGFFLGLGRNKREWYSDDRYDLACAYLGVNFKTFYARLDRLTLFNRNWRLHAKICARGLRNYAAIYHPIYIPEPIVRKNIPQSILNLFRPKARATIKIEDYV